MWSTRVLALIVFPVLVGGCASGRTAYPGEGPSREIEIEVLNLNFNDATLHALRLGQRVRLGIVTGKQTEIFRLEWPISLPIQIEIKLLAGDRCVTRELTADPGDRLYLEIPLDLNSGALCVRR